MNRLFRNRRARIVLLFLALLFVLPLPWRESISAAEAPEWNGITPSVSTRADVEAIMGKPDMRWPCSLPFSGMDRVRHVLNCLPRFWVENYGYEDERSSYDLIRYEIEFNGNDTVRSIAVTQWREKDAETDNRITLPDILSQYGLPEYTTWSHRSSAQNVLLYCEQGLLVHASGEQTVNAIIYIAPMPTERCINEFYHDIAMTNPYEGTDVEGSQDPWGFNER